MDTKILPSTAQIVSLIKISKPLFPNQIPGCLEYDHPLVIGVTPCIKQDGFYVDLRTGKKVTLLPDMLEWPVFVGTVFQYPDEKKLLVSRKAGKTGEIILLDDEFKYSPQTMVLHHVV